MPSQDEAPPPTRLPPSPADRTQPAKVRFLVIGRILGAVGLTGDVRAQVLTDFPERFGMLRTVHVGDNLRPYRVEGATLDGDQVVLHLTGVNDAAAAQALRNADLQVPIAEAMPLERDQYFWHQIEGLAVWTEEGEYLGRVTEVLRTGSNDVYVVETGDRELLLPAIDEVIRDVDLARQRLTVHLLPGLRDEAR